MIVVTTPTGQIGRHVVRGLLDAGEDVRVVVRDPARLADDVADRVDVVQGDHSEPALTMRAFAGADAVFHVVPPNPAAEDVPELYRAFAEAAAPALTGNRVRRVVAVSTLGRGYQGNAGHLSAALDAEPILLAAGVDQRSLAMPFFMDNLLAQSAALRDHGMFSMPNTADRELLVVATPDIGRAAVDLLVDPDWTGQGVVPVVSPDHLTPNQMADVLSEVLGKEIQYQQTSVEDYSATLAQYGLSPAWVRGLADMATAQNDGIYDVEPRDTEALAPTTFRVWAQRALAPAVQDAAITARRRP
jgi:uncharacterized protein YbjT (DUF2867 family)